MIHVFSIRFNVGDAIRLFRGAGLVVEQVEMDFDFKQGKERLRVWAVVNPFDLKPVFLEDAFRRFIDSRKNRLFLENVPDLDVYELFKEWER
jgi:hypothetical protein